MVISPEDVKTAVKNVIGAFSHELSAGENVELLKKFKRDDLIETHKFLKTLDDTDYPAASQSLSTKSRNIKQYSEDIINFINLLKPTLCKVCNENYVPTRDDFQDASVKCHLCQRGAPVITTVIRTSQ